jgi:hypothetical protein
MAYCTTDELLEAMFGRYKLEDWVGIPQSVKAKLYDLPDHIREKVLNRSLELDAHDFREITGELNPTRQKKLNNSRGDMDTMMLASAWHEKLVQAMGGRQKGQMLGGEAIYAAHQYFMKKANRLADDGRMLADLIRNGNDAAMTEAVKDLNELMAIGQQMTGNASELGRALRWMRNIKEAEKSQQKFAQLFGTFEC